MSVVRAEIEGKWVKDIYGTHLPAYLREQSTASRTRVFPFGNELTRCEIPASMRNVEMDVDSAYTLQRCSVFEAVMTMSSYASLSRAAPQSGLIPTRPVPNPPMGAATHIVNLPFYISC